MMTEEKCTKIVDFMTPGEGVPFSGHGHIVKMQLFFSSCPNWDMDQKNKVNRNDNKEMVYQNCDFPDPWG